VLRGLHYHHRQVDYWHCAAGCLRVGLVDLRPASPTRGRAQVVELGQERLSAVFIPVGVAHGFYAVTDAMLFYLVDNYYDGTDELGVAWDDPALGLDWGLEGAPVLSERDRRNLRLAEIPADRLPR
jgi:dTDP-4-dehydrorhamnose 3,5-epimerase